MTVFPESQRVIYDQNTLAEVVCQLRFPTILRIDAAAPADFQDAVRDAYPLFAKADAQTLPPGLPPEIARMLAADLSMSGSAYEFSSADKVWKLSLTKDFVALTTTEYARWEDFRDHLMSPLESLKKFYGPAFYVRIGLRYRNVINPASIGIEKDWADLIAQNILGELGDREIGARIESASRDVVICLDNNAKVRLQHGLGKDNQTQQQVYVIDADYHTSERIEVDNAITTLDSFNAESGKLFRWCITDDLHNAMGPKPA